MSEPILSLLLVDDEDSVREPLAHHLRAEPYKYEVKDVADFEEALQALEETKGRFDVALIDEVLGEGPGGLDLLRQIKAIYPQIECILFTGWGMQSGLEALRAGTYRYFAKPFNLEELALTIHFAADKKRIHREREYLSTLVQVSRELTQTTDLEKQLALVWSFVQERLATATFFIALYDSKTDTLRFPLSFDEGKPDPLPDRHLGDDPSGWGVAGYVVKNRQELVWFSLKQSEQEWQALGIMPQISGKGPSETGICLPLQVGDKILGSLSVQSYQPQAFDSAFLNAVRTLGGHIAPAIENARLFQEITQRTSEVETTRDHLDRLVASSFDGIITIDTHGTVTGFSAMAEKILGYRAKEVLGKSVRNLYYDPEEPKRIGKLLRQVADGKLTDYETSVKNKRSDRIPIRLSATWLFDAKGNRIGNAGYFRDLRHIQEMEMQRQRLLEASKAVAQATSLEEGLQSLSRIMVESCIATYCTILLLTPDEKGLIVKAAYPFPRGEQLKWNPGVGKVCTPFQEARVAKILMSDKPTIFRQGRKKANKFLLHLAEEIKLPKPQNSILIVPLQTNEKRLGICILGEMRDWDRSPITDRKVELAQSLANQTAIFIEKIGLYEMTRKKTELLEALDALSLTIRASLNLDEILIKTCQVAVELIGVDHSGLMIFDSDYVKGKVVAEYPATMNSKGTEFLLHGVPLEEKLIEEREPILIFDMENEEGLGRVGELMYDQFNIHSTVFIPVVSKDKILGSFSLDAIGHKRQFAQDEIELCKIFASHVASAIENAHLHSETIQLYQEADAAREKIRASYEASNALVLSQSTAQLMEDIIRQAQKAAGASWVSVVLIDELGLARNLFTTGSDKQVDIGKVIRHDGVTMQVMRTGISEKIEDVRSQRKRVNPRMFRNKVAAALCLPFAVQGKRIGVGWIHYSEPHCFPDYEIEALQLFVNQAAIAYDSARRIEELDHMRKAAEAMAKALEPSKVLQQIVESACDVLQADSSAIWSYDNVRNQFIPEELVAHEIPASKLKRFQKAEPKKGGTADTVMRQGWVEVTNLSDPQYDFMGPSTVKLLKSIGAKSFQGVALKVSDEKLGVLYVNYNHPRSFTEDDRRTLETFAYHAALAQKNARLLAQVSKARDVAKVVAQVTILGNREATLSSVAGGTQQAVGCDVVTLYTYEHTTGKLDYPPVMVGVADPQKATRYREVPLNSIVYEMLRQDDLYIVPVISEDALFKDRRFAQDEKIESCVAIPLKTAEQKVGVMFVNYHLRHNFTSDELTNIQLFAHQAAVAIRNAQLYQAEQRRVKELSGLNSISQAIRLLTDVKQVYQQINASVARLAGAEMCAVLLYEEAKEELVCQLPMFGVPNEIGQRYRISVGDGEPAAIWEQADYLIINDVEQHPLAVELGLSGLANEIGLRHTLLVKLTTGNRNIGVVQASNKLDGTAFTEHDAQLLSIFASQAAAVIENARLLSDISRHSTQLQTVADISKSTSTLLDPEKLLDHAVNVIRDRFSFYYVGLFLVDEAGRHAVLRAGTGEAGRNMLRDRHKLAIDGLSMIGWCITNAQARVASNVSDEAIHFDNPHLPDTYSEMALPLIRHDRRIGALTVQSNQKAAFTKDDIVVLQAMADQLAIAIENAQQYEMLEKTREALAGRTALAWTGMASSTWRHAIEKHAVTIREQTQLLRDDIQEQHTAESLARRVDMIERLASLILEKQITPPLSSEEGVQRIPVNELIRERTKQLWKSDPYRPVPLDLQLDLNDDATIWASAEWIRRALDILIDNAVEAMEGITAPRLTIASRSNRDSVEIAVSDNGKGIPQEIQSRLFHQPIRRSRKKGQGMGLMFAQVILQTYRGHVRVDSTDPTGTTMTVSLPLEY